MSLSLFHLDPRARVLMHDEVQYDIARGHLFLSARLTNPGRISYLPALLEAIAHGDVDTFASTILRGRLLKQYEESHSRRGIPYSKAVPSDAHLMLAEGEFNRFYIRGLCVRAMEDGIQQLEIYRAKAVPSPRPESEARVGKRIPASDLLRDLRAHTGVELALGVPGGPNSGLSARLPANSNTSAI